MTLKIAVPNKGALSEDAVLLLKEAGYKCVRYGRELTLLDKANDVEFIFLRPRDVAIYVGRGIIELGITGRDLAIDSGSDVDEVLALGFGRSQFRYAAPKGGAIRTDNLGGLRIATSYPALVARDLAKRGVKAEIVRLDGAVEVSVRLGVADLIADVVESGRTLAEAGLEVIGETMLRSEAILICRKGNEKAIPMLEKLIARLRGILVARTYAMIEYDVPKSALDAVCRITPGIEAPTISPLSKSDWVAVKAMIERQNANGIMDALYEAGARGIIVCDLANCRI
ncbi:MAG: ATP phosphoribosyltransferase [Victivallaceae bacterium]|nr:ATP phosphoribosyltransferase [Victivallaceae bacterium]